MEQNKELCDTEEYSDRNHVITFIKTLEYNTIYFKEYKQQTVLNM